MINSLFRENKITQGDMTFVDTDTDPKVGEWLDMRLFSKFGALLNRISGDNDVTAMRILGNTELDGSGDDVAIAEWVMTEGNPAAFGDKIVLECTQHDILKAGYEAGKKIVAVALEVTVAVEAAETDVFLATYIRGGGTYISEPQTVDVIA